MSSVRRSEAIELFASLWGSDSQRWSRDQHMMAAEVDKLFLETKTITHSGLMKRVNQLLTANPEAYKADENEKIPSGSSSRLLLVRNTRRQREEVLTEIAVRRSVKPPTDRAIEDETAEPQNPSKVVSRYGMKSRILRLRNRIAQNILHLALGQAPVKYKIKPENLGLRQPFGSDYDCLAKIHDYQLLLYTRMEELDDTSLRARIMNEASGWSVGTSTEHGEQLLVQIQHALENLKRDTLETDPAAMTKLQTNSAIQNLRRRLGMNSVKIAKGIELRRFGGAVDLIGPRAEQFQGLLSSEGRQFAMTHILAALDDQDVKNAYQAFTQRFGDLWDQGSWSAKVCHEYEEGLIKQERLASQALKRERRHKIGSEASRLLETSQTVEKPPRSPLPSYPAAGNQAFEQQELVCGGHTENASLPHARPSNANGANKQSHDSLDIPGSQQGDLGVAAHEKTNVLAASNTAFLESRSLSYPDHSPKLTIRLDPAGVRGKAMSRHLRWTPDDTRDVFLNRVAELFPGKVLQQVNARLPGTQVIIQSTGPQEEWEIVREEWLKRLKQPSKKEPSAAVYLVE